MHKTTLPLPDDPVPARAARRRTGGMTLVDVARVAGVSAITVSRALNTPEML